MVLDIVEGQGRGEGPKMAKIQHGVKPTSLNMPFQLAAEECPMEVCAALQAHLSNDWLPRRWHARQ